ncbi:G-protein coupled receptors family 1 profile domain-containing protein [Caenorhabditis elegans]|uniref:G-protein coupled receptors family 1 profile domain-containing protein n=1 Tax=Caenorhabditis elegans TaxID=6239 RepID=O16415_CAEEL|nr:G-protein coupled receptors family 1 profile domain-containing protein [Caenorhabditis elegans]CCD70832.2 G-protein coupled receptors family 1 profile domain-containing protein [Caenorhabditis elegans]|eukprot:NP_001309503.1 Serpentine Receptor, class W [Caenorhabditis elegans]
MAQCDIQFHQYYPKFQKKTAIILCRFQENFVAIVTQITSYEYIASVVCFLINIVHILVLTRKSMRTSCINITMTAVAIYDIFSFFSTFEVTAIEIISRYSKCFNTMSYHLVSVDLLLYLVNQYARRCSTWLLFSVAVIRTLVLRNPMNPKYTELSKPSTALRVIFGVSAICIIFSISTVFENDVGVVGKQPSKCSSHGVLMYAFTISDLFLLNDGLLLKVSTFTAAIVSHIIPCIIFPIITVLLVKELRKTDERRKNSTSSKKITDSRKTTKLVFYNTILFLIAEFPLGVSMAITWFFVDVPGLQLICNHCLFLFSMILTINTCSHFIISMLMSSQYRKTAMNLFSIE